MKEFLKWAKAEYDKNPRIFAILFLAVFFILLGLTGDLNLPAFGKLSLVEPYRTMSIGLGILSLCIALFISIVGTSKEKKQQARIKEIQTCLMAKFSANFKIVDDDNNDDSSLFYRTTAATLVEEINYLLRQSNGAKEIVVGIVGGSTILRLCQYLLANRKTINSYDYKQVIFVSLNTAGIYNLYQYSANYLCVQLSQIFNGSSHCAYTASLSNNEQRIYADYVNRIDLLLCSAGSNRDGFLSEWLCRRSPLLSMPGQVVGDFCLIPVDQTGNVVVCTGELQAEISQLNSQPVFRSLRELEDKFRVILPVMENPRVPAPNQTPRRERTQKKEITVILLNSRVVSHCILNKSMAEALCNG